MNMYIFFRNKICAYAFLADKAQREANRKSGAGGGAGQGGAGQGGAGQGGAGQGGAGQGGGYDDACEEMSRVVDFLAAHYEVVVVTHFFDVLGVLIVVGVHEFDGPHCLLIYLTAMLLMEYFLKSKPTQV